MSSRGPDCSMVGIATSGINRPRFSVGRSAKGNDAIMVVGHERLGVLSLASPATEGEVLFNQLISPELIGARLKGFSKLYDRYYFQRMTFKYVPLISQLMQTPMVELLWLLIMILLILSLPLTEVA